MPDHVCQFCNAHFPTNSKLQRHLDSHTLFGGYLCDLCDKFFRRESNMLQHWRKTCDPVRAFLSEEERLEIPAHLLKEVVFRYIISRNEHLSTEQPSSSCAPPSSFFTYCNYCNISMPSYAISQHYSVHHGKSMPGDIIKTKLPCFVCDLCGLSFRMKSYLINHWRKSCGEMLAHIKNNRGPMLNNELIDLVGFLVKKASVCEPPLQLDVSIKNNGGEGSRSCEQNIEYLEYSDDFPMRTNLELETQKRKWLKDFKTCRKCDRNFANQGRLEWHTEIVHGEADAKEKCEFCWQKFRDKIFLIEHLRKSCVSLKVDVPDNFYRQKLSVEELMKLMEEAKNTWGKWLQQKKERNLMDIRQIINELDSPSDASTSAACGVSTPPVILSDIASPLPRTRKRPALSEDSVPCHVCKVFFSNPSSLRKHMEAAHSIRDCRNSRLNQEKSLMVLPIICAPKPQTAQFFDEEGVFYRKGRYLESYPEITEDLTPNEIKSGFTFRLEMEDSTRKCMIMEICGNMGTNSRFMVLEEEDIEIAFDGSGELKKFYRRNPDNLSDLPVLERQI